MSKPSLTDNYSLRARSGFILAVSECTTDQIATLRDLVHVDRETLCDITLGELFPLDGDESPTPAAAAPKPAKAGAKPKPATPTPAKLAPPKLVPAKLGAFTVADLNLRDSGDRDKFDEIVIGALTKARDTEGMHDLDGDGVPWCKSMTIRDMITGCEPGPLRTCWTRLVAAGKIISTGKAAGTKYTLAGT